MADIEEDMDLNELVAEIVADANIEAEGTGHSIVWNKGTPALLHGRPDILGAAVGNVVRNALKHAPERRDIIIETRVDTTRAAYCIEVLD
jgi:two-component system, OmpR family, sensor kinase